MTASETRRILGIETEFGLTCVTAHPGDLPPDEVARLLFQPVVEWGRSTNVFLANGSRLYLDVGSHPEYATAECSDPYQLIAVDRAGEKIMASLVASAQDHLDAEAIDGTIHMFKNNTDSAGNSYGCHENYLVRRRADVVRLADVLVPYLITRQIAVGAGKVLPVGSHAIYCFSQRADHVWEAVSSATTRSRPIINTRDEPHADAAHYRRLHVIVGDSSMAEATTLLKVGATDLLLRAFEAGLPVPAPGLVDPMRAIRETSHDLSGKAPIELTDGTTSHALGIQRDYLTALSLLVDSGDLPIHRADRDVLDLWGRALDAVESGDYSGIDTEIDWAIKLRLVRRYQERTGADLADPRIARLDLAYHDIVGSEGLYGRLAARGLVRRVVTDDDIARATDNPPQTTRAAIRGEFVRRASHAHSSYAVDWTHLKLDEDGVHHTAVLADPFATSDPEADALLDRIGQ